MRHPLRKRLLYHPRGRKAAGGRIVVVIWFLALAWIPRAAFATICVQCGNQVLNSGPAPGQPPGMVIAGPYATGTIDLGTVVYTTLGIGVRQGVGELLPQWFGLAEAATTLHAVSLGSRYNALVLYSIANGFVGGYDPCLGTVSGTAIVPPVDAVRMYGLGNPKAALVVDAQNIRLIAGGAVVAAAPRAPGAFLGIAPTPFVPNAVDVTFAGGVVTFSLEGQVGNCPLFISLRNAPSTALVPITAPPPAQAPALATESDGPSQAAGLPPINITSQEEQTHAVPAMSAWMLALLGVILVAARPVYLWRLSRRPRTAS